MRVAVLGASGRTGRHVVETLLAEGHEVSALSRRPYAHPGVRVVQGDALDRMALERLVEGAGAVIVVLGPSAGAPSDVCSAATRLLIGVMRAAGLRRLVVQTGAMIGHPRLGRFYRWMERRKALADNLAERREQERLVRESGLEWTLIRPARLTNGPGTGLAQVGDLRVGIGASVARRDVARVLAKAATEGKWNGEGVAVVSSFTAGRPAPVMRAWLWRLGLSEMLGIAAAAAVALAFMAAFGVPTTAAMTVAFLLCMVAAGALEGALLGALPGAMLQRIFPSFPVGRFTLATVAVAMLGWLVGMMPSTLVSEAADASAAVEPGLLDVVAVSAIGGAAGGALIGFAQWLVMKSHVPRAGRWIIATSLGWALALPLDMLAGMLPSETDGWVGILGTALVFGLGAGLAVALPTGVLVIDMLRERDRRMANGESQLARPGRPAFA